MTIADWIMILAAISAPLVAMFTQRMVDEIREKRRRKSQLSAPQMATGDRDSRVSPAHVQALNMIDIEFTVKSKLLDKLRVKVKSSDEQQGWHALIEVLNEEISRSISC